MIKVIAELNKEELIAWLDRNLAVTMESLVNDDHESIQSKVRILTHEVNIVQQIKESLQ